MGSGTTRSVRLEGCRRGPELITAGQTEQDKLDPAVLRAVSASQADVQGVVDEKHAEDQRAADLGALAVLGLALGALASVPFL